MKILSDDQIRSWDQYTIENEPILSIDLMERAAEKCVEWLLDKYSSSPSFSIFCGKGNNGGDGLAIARMLYQQQIAVTIYIVESGKMGSADFQKNLERLHAILFTDIHYIHGHEHFPAIASDRIVIDALFGSGLNRSLDGVWSRLVKHINDFANEVISIDIPSGMFTDQSSVSAPVIKASHTLSFQCYKLAFLLAENESNLGQLHILDIGLHPGYYDTISSAFELVDAEMIRPLYRPRKASSHKGSYGHALLIGGSEGKMGAAVLMANACLRSGVGLLTVHVPAAGIPVLQISMPEAMVLVEDIFSYPLDKHPAIGVGPGWGTGKEAEQILKYIIEHAHVPLVLDADALNIIAANPALLEEIPSGSILTPHPKEFSRLFGQSGNDVERALLAVEKASQHNCYIILKGHHSLITTPSGKGYFTNTGNAGMATGGSGDVLTGILTGLLAQGYPPLEAALLGTWLHGTAGDHAAVAHSMPGMIARDIIEHIGRAYQDLVTD